MALVTREQLAALRQAVRDHMMAYLVETYGQTMIPHDEITRLVEAGILDVQAAGELEFDYLRDAFVSGMVLARLQDLARTPNLSLADIERELRRNPIPLSAEDVEALDWAREGAAMHCRHLGDRIVSTVEGLVFEEDGAQRMRNVEEVRDAVGIAVAERRSPKWLRGELGRRVVLYEQDLDRIAATELQDAHNEGAARVMLEQHGAGATCIKIPNPKACEKCIELYIDDDGNPRVFTVAELVANGTNFGRPRSDWLPVVGTTHPWCACVLRRLPPGFEFHGGILVPIGHAP